jgi:hypothetical protein
MSLKRLDCFSFSPKLASGALGSPGIALKQVKVYEVNPVKTHLKIDLIAK